jgi:cyclic pyranopterin phosphate synthase
MKLIDFHGRIINYLRLSVTDRCNMRCFYCMPQEGIVSRGHDAVLTYEELLLIAETAVQLGIEKIRITGGGTARPVRYCQFSQQTVRHSRLETAGPDH